MGHFKIDDEFWVFEIQTDFAPTDYCRCVTYGSPDTCIEVRIDNLTGIIYDIQCIYLGDIMSEPVFRFQDFRSDPDLDARDKPFCFELDDAHRLPCIVNVTRDEMQLIFGVNSFDPCFYYADGRVEYYYDDCMNLLYIKVVDLTEKEFEFLMSSGAAGEYAHWV